MQADGWWWQSPALSNKGIKRQILKEMLFNRKKIGGIATKSNATTR